MILMFKKFFICLMTMEVSVSQPAEFYVNFLIGPEDILGNMDYELGSRSTKANAMRILRAMQLPRPILLEGSPGVGKTSLIDAIAKASGHKLVRINLSEQTDVSDLFGADLPVEGAESGEFAWRDGPLLQALKNQHWILLDEEGGMSYLEHEDPDVLCIQETKCSKDKLPEELQIEGYHCHWLAGDKKGYSGVELISKTKPVSITEGIGHSTKYEEPSAPA